MDQLVEAVQVVAVHEDLRSRQTGTHIFTFAHFHSLLVADAGRGARLYPLPGLVFEEGSDDGVQSVDVPRLVHKVDPSESGRKTVLLEKKKRKEATGISL